MFNEEEISSLEYLASLFGEDFYSDILLAEKNMPDWVEKVIFGAKKQLEIKRKEAEKLIKKVEKKLQEKKQEKDLVLEEKKSAELDRDQVSKWRFFKRGGIELLIAQKEKILIRLNKEADEIVRERVKLLAQLQSIKNQSIPREIFADELAIFVKEEYNSLSPHSFSSEKIKNLFEQFARERDIISWFGCATRFIWEFNSGNSDSKMSEAKETLETSQNRLKEVENEISQKKEALELARLNLEKCKKNPLVDVDAQIEKVSNAQNNFDNLNEQIKGLQREKNKLEEKIKRCDKTINELKNGRALVDRLEKEIAKFKWEGLGMDEMENLQGALSDGQDLIISLTKERLDWMLDEAKRKKRITKGYDERIDWSSGKKHEDLFSYLKSGGSVLEVICRPNVTYRCKFSNCNLRHKDDGYIHVEENYRRYFITDEHNYGFPTSRSAAFWIPVAVLSDQDKEIISWILKKVFARIKEGLNDVVGGYYNSPTAYMSMCLNLLQENPDSWNWSCLKLI